MGNAVSDEYDARSAPEPMKGNAALYAFIEDECPIVNKAMLSSDRRLRESVVAVFNKVLTNQHFDSILDIMIYMESKRMQRIEFLKSISEERFSKTPAAKLPCIAIRINDKIAIAFMDTGCGMSCLTRRASTKLALDGCIIQNVKGLATGFGNHTNIIGVAPNIAVQSGEMVFQVNFLVLEKASADFIILGSDFIVQNKLRLDFKNGQVVLPRRVVEEKTVSFIPPINNEAQAAELIVRMVENTNVTRTLGFLPDVVNQTHVFINVCINGTEVQAMIDSGAEASMISLTTAARLKLFKFADLRMHRVSHGLGPVVIIGRIPPIPVEFDETTTLFIPFDVLNGIEQEMLILGADFLTYYGCQVNCAKNDLDISLDSVRSYKLGEKQNTDASNMLKDSGLGSLLGLEQPATRRDTEQAIRSSPENDSSSNYDEAQATPKILKAKAKSSETQFTPKREPKDEYITMSLDSMSVVTLSL